MTPYEIEVEANKVMARIQEPRKLNYRYKLSLVVVVILVGLFIPSLFQTTPIQITKVSANDYLLSLPEEELKLNVYGVVKNDKVTPINNEVVYYEGGQKYIDITEQLNIDVILIEDYIFLEIKTPNEESAYFYLANHHKHYRAVVPLERDFDDFEKEMLAIVELTKQYPYEQVELEGAIPGCLDFYPTEQIKEQSLEKQEDYDWFLNQQGAVCSDLELTEFVLGLKYNGTEDDIGTLENEDYHIGTTGDVYRNQSPFSYTKVLAEPFRITGREIQETESIKVRSDIDIFEDKVAISAQITMDEINPFDYEFELTYRDQQVPIENIKIEDDKVYILPVFIEEDLNTIVENDVAYLYFETELRLTITNKKTKEVIIHENVDNLQYPMEWLLELR